jgi:hypothetical protein
MKLIKLSETHYIIVDDSEIKEGDFALNVKIKRLNQARFMFDSTDCKKITHSTQPLENLSCRCRYGSIMTFSHPCKKECQNPKLGFNKIKPLSLLEVEESINGYSVEKSLNELYTKDENLFSMIDNMSYKIGFSAHKELVKDKLFTIEQVLSIINEIGFVKTTHEELNYKNYQPFITDEDGEFWTINKEHIQKYIQSLLTKTEWEVEFDERCKLKLI